MLAEEGWWSEHALYLHLHRPWCVGEITTARLHGLDTVLFILPECQWPTRAFVDEYPTHVEGVLSLAASGISVEMAQDTLSWLSSCPQIKLPEEISLAAVDEIAAKLTGFKKEQSKRSVQNTDEEKNFGHVLSRTVSEPTDCAASFSVDVASTVDNKMQESVYAALFLKEMFKSHFPLGDRLRVNVRPTACARRRSSTSRGSWKENDQCPK